MTTPVKTAEEVSIVLVGSLNPSIFHPLWFAKNGLLPDAEVEKAAIVICHPDVAQFSISWLRFDVTNERFLVACNDSSHFAPMRDLVVGTFALLVHTPLRQLGINSKLEFSTASPEVWHCIGHTLAPKDIWKNFFVEPGLKNLTIESRRSDDRRGSINTTIFPSNRQKNAVGVLINSHYDIDDITTAEVMTLIESDWDATLAISADAAQKIVEIASAADEGSKQ